MDTQGTTSNYYRQLLQETRGLPALAAVVTKVMTAVIEETSAREIAELIEKDSAITSRVLKVVNSAYYGVSGHVSTVTQAVPILGIKVIKNIVLTFSVMDIFAQGKGKGVDFKKLWEHSFTTAVASRALAKRADYGDPEEALVAGLLHDVGILLFVKHGQEEYGQVNDLVRMSGRPLLSVEQEVMGIDHAELGALLAEKWQLPEILVAPIRYHHNPETLEQGGRQLRRLVQLVHLADRMSHLFTEPVDEAKLLGYAQVLHEGLGIQREELPSVMNEISADVEQTAKDFMVKVDTPKSYLEILEEAHLELGRMNLSQLMATDSRK